MLSYRGRKEPSSTRIPGNGCSKYPDDQKYHRHGESSRLLMVVAFLCAGFFLYMISSTLTLRHNYMDGILSLGSNNGGGLADGCYHIFLDVGANIGVHGRFLYQSQEYPDAEIARGLFDQEFGPADKRDNRDFCVFEFEPNPNHLPRLQQTSDAYKKMGWRYFPMPFGVSDEDGTITFYKQGDDKRMEWGFTAFSPILRKGKEAEKIEIPVIRFSDWLQKNVLNRHLPSKVYGNYQGLVNGDGQMGGPKVVMKMDIEAMEFRVLPDLLFSGVLCKALDFVFGELHDDKMFYPIHLSNNVTFTSGKKGRAHLESILRAVQANPNCKTRIVEEDDEAYLRDGVDLPVPKKS